MTNNFLTALEKIFPAERLLLNAPLAHHTTFQIGGAADYLAFPAAPQETAAALKLAAQKSVPVTVLGNGSNVLVLDGGVRGLVLKFGGSMAGIRRNGNKITAGAGAKLADICLRAAEYSLSGLEFAIGIPGSAGGSAFMNAGAYDGEMGKVVSSVLAVDADFNLRAFSRAEINFGYRRSAFQENKAVICEVEFELAPGEKAQIAAKMTDFTERRETKQPLEAASAGSAFKRPPGHFAGTLIEQAGLKGAQVGGAQISFKHAGFIINAGGATARDVLGLIKKVQDRVYEHAGVHLTPEVRIIGEP